MSSGQCCVPGMLVGLVHCLDRADNPNPLGYNLSGPGPFQVLSNGGKFGRSDKGRRKKPFGFHYERGEGGKGLGLGHRICRSMWNRERLCSPGVQWPQKQTLISTSGVCEVCFGSSSSEMLTYGLCLDSFWTLFVLPSSTLLSTTRLFL